MLRRLLPTLIALSCLGPASAGAQEVASGLSTEILRRDSLLFAAFNRHDLEAVMSFFAEDVEFLHDQDGALSRLDLEQGFRSLFARDNALRRDRVDGASEVHPVPGFGAIQIGRHRFCHDEDGREDCGTFGFTHVWRRAGEDWKIARALSYGH
jgi:ketosteroid isomerase-like protein